MFFLFLNFSQRCSDCESFTPLWQKVGDELNNLVTVADFDCAHFSKICRSYAIKNYPTFIWVDDGEIIESIPKERAAKQLVSYARKKCASRPKREIGAEEIATDNITEIVGRDYNSTIALDVTLVVFCVPWCSQCKQALSLMVELRNHFQNNTKVKIVKLDCSKDENREICFTQLNNGVPTTNLYCNGQLTVYDYHGDRFEEVKDMIECNCGESHERLTWKKRDRERKKKKKEEQKDRHSNDHDD